MNTHHRNLRAALPAHYADMVYRISHREFQIVGLPEGIEDRTFSDRQQAEEFLVKHLPVIDKKLKRGPRACLCCTRNFISTGPGHRLCNDCRNPYSERLAL